MSVSVVIFASLAGAAPSLSQRTFSLAGSSFPSKVVEFIKK